MRKGSLWNHIQEKRRERKRRVQLRHEHSNPQFLSKSQSFLSSLTPRGLSPRFQGWRSRRRDQQQRPQQQRGKQRQQQSDYADHPFWKPESQIKALVCERISLNLGRFCLYSEMTMYETMTLTITKDLQAGNFRVKRENAMMRRLSEVVVQQADALAILDDMVECHPCDVIVRTTQVVPLRRRDISHSFSSSMQDELESELATIVHDNVPIASMSSFSSAHAEQSSESSVLPENCKKSSDRTRNSNPSEKGDSRKGERYNKHKNNKLKPMYHSWTREELSRSLHAIRHSSVETRGRSSSSSTCTSSSDFVIGNMRLWSSPSSCGSLQGSLQGSPMSSPRNSSLVIPLH